MNPATRYATVSAASAEPDQLLVDLHARLGADLRDAAALLRAGRPRQAREALQHARRVLLLLNRTLDPHADPHLAKDLHAIYLWALKRLDDGDLAALSQIHRLIQRLQRAWSTTHPTGEPSPDL